MAEQVFPFFKPEDILRKARKEYRDFNSCCLELNAQEASYALFNCASSIWHYVVDWHPKFRDLNAREYLNELISQCPDLRVCGDICTGYKHVYFDRKLLQHTIAKRFWHEEKDISDTLRIIDPQAPNDCERPVIRFYFEDKNKKCSKRSVKQCLLKSLIFLDQLELVQQ